MSKKLVILEDVFANIKYLSMDIKNRLDVENITVILFVVNREEGEKKKLENKTWLKENKIEYRYVTVWNIKEILDMYYKDENVAFLFDMALEGDGSNTWANRINILYAKKKQKICMEQNQNERIWFYTAIRTDDQWRQLDETFPDRVLDIEENTQTGLSLDLEHGSAAKEFVKFLKNQGEE